MVAVEHRPGQAAPVTAGSLECVFDEFGAHVVGDRPAGEFAGETVDHGGQVQIAALRQRQVGDVADVDGVGPLCGEVPPEQVGVLLVGWLGQRGPDPAAEPDPGQPVVAHHPGDPLVVDPLLGRHAVVEFSGHPGCPVGGVTTGLRVLDGPDPFGELGIGHDPFGPGRCGGAPGVER